MLLGFNGLRVVLMYCPPVSQNRNKQHNMRRPLTCKTEFGRTCTLYKCPESTEKLSAFTKETPTEQGNWNRTDTEQSSITFGSTCLFLILGFQSGRLSVCPFLWKLVSFRCRPYRSPSPPCCHLYMTTNSFRSKERSGDTLKAKLSLYFNAMT